VGSIDAQTSLKFLPYFIGEPKSYKEVKTKQWFARCVVGGILFQAHQDARWDASLYVDRLLVVIVTIRQNKRQDRPFRGELGAEKMINLIARVELNRFLFCIKGLT